MSVFFRRRGKASVLDDNFANNSWEAIIAACQSGNVPDSWAVGDSKMMTINGTDYQIDIIGKNHDTYTAGGTAPLTFQMHDCYPDEMMNNSDTNNGGWTNCRMRKSSLPDILALMPSEVQTAIREVNKLTSADNQSDNIVTEQDKLFLLSEIEIFGIVRYSKSDEGTQYDYYKAGNSKVKKFKGTTRYWWERSPRSKNYGYFCCVDRAGHASCSYVTADDGVAFAFCF